MDSIKVNLGLIYFLNSLGLGLERILRDAFVLIFLTDYLLSNKQFEIIVVSLERLYHVNLLFLHPRLGAGDLNHFLALMGLNQACRISRKEVLTLLCVVDAINDVHRRFKIGALLP